MFWLITMKKPITILCRKNRMYIYTKKPIDEPEEIGDWDGGGG